MKTLFLVAVAWLGFLGRSPALAAPVSTVGSLIMLQPVAQTVTAASAYAAGNAVGGLMTLPSATNSTGGSGLVQSVVEYTKSAQTAQTDVFLFNANPSGSTCTDKTAFALAAADLTKVVGVVHVTDWSSAGTPSVGQGQNQAMPFDLPSGTALFACAVTRGTPTFASTSDVSFAFNVLQNQ